MTMRNKELQLASVVERAIEIYATTPEVTHQHVADTVGINFKTLMRIRRDPNFWAKVYDYYMTTFEGDVVGILKAAVREGLAGNVAAQRLVLEHSGKLQKNINITIDSPFEKWMKKAEVGNDAVEAEIINDFGEDIVLPERTADNSTKSASEQLKKLRNSQNKAKRAKSRNKLRREQHKWLKRAELAGIEPLPAGRPTKGQKKAWEDSIIAQEMKASKSKKE